MLYKVSGFKSKNSPFGIMIRNILFVQLKFSRSTALPTSVRERLLNMRLHVHLGILPTCALAFAVVDNTLLTWSLDWDDPNMSVSVFQSAHGAITLVHRIPLRHGKPRTAQFLSTPPPTTFGGLKQGCVNFYTCYLTPVINMLLTC